MNTVILTGRLTKDAETKYTPQGTAVVNLSIAVNDYRGKDAEEATYFFECFAYGERWEKLSSYLKKGTKVTIGGKLVQQSWVNSDGQKRSTVKIQLNELEFCGGKSNNQKTESKEEPSTPQVDIDEDSIPF